MDNLEIRCQMEIRSSRSSAHNKSTSTRGILGVSKVYMGLSVAIPTYIEYNKGDAGRRGLCKFLNANSNSIKVNHQQPKRTVPYIEVGPGRRVCRVDFQMRIKNIYWPVLQPWAPTFETLCCGSGG